MLNLYQINIVSLFGDTGPGNSLLPDDTKLLPQTIRNKYLDVTLLQSQPHTSGSMN